jgi:hypothetical protein
MVAVGDCAAGAPSSAAICCPQPPQNRVPGSTEYPQDGHQLSILAIASLSGVPCTSMHACMDRLAPRVTPPLRDGTFSGIPSRLDRHQSVRPLSAGAGVTVARPVTAARTAHIALIAGDAAIPIAGGGYLGITRELGETMAEAARLLKQAYGQMP